MNIHEYQAKSLLEQYGVAVPKGIAAMGVEEAAKAAQELPGPLYVVKAQIHSIPPRYELEDLTGQQVKGSFYEPELLLVKDFSNKVFKIDKVLGYRKRKNKPREAKVTWYGYPISHASFIPASDIKKYTPQ